MVPSIIDKGQSFDHIFASIQDKIGISKSTLYRYIDKGYLKDIKNIDLSRRVRYKQPSAVPTTVKKETKQRQHRTYLDFLAFCSHKPNASICEMDSVERVKGGKVLLTLHLRKSNFMMSFIRDTNNSQSVIDIFNRLETNLSKARFTTMFHTVLTDNGSEFAKADALECTNRPLKRCNLYYCDARASQQKGKIERTMNTYVSMYHRVKASITYRKKILTK